MSKAEIVLSAVDQTKAAIDSAARNLRGLGDQAKALPAAFGAIGVSFAAAFAVSKLQGVIDGADALNKLSQKSGLITEDLSQLQYAAKLADVSTESLSTSIKKLNISVAEGLAGDKEKLELFKSLKITQADLAKGTKEVLLQMADAYAKAPDGPGKLAVNNGLLGKSAEDMIPLLNAGSKGISNLMLEAQKLGLTISTDFAKDAEEFNDNLTRLKVSGDRLAVSLGADLVRGLGEAMKAMADASIEGGKFQGVLAGIRQLLTGSDQYKNDKQMVELTDAIMESEKKLAKSRADGTKGITKDTEERLAGLRAELSTTMSYRKTLEADADRAKATKAAANAPKKADDEIKVQKRDNGASAARARDLKEEAKLILELAGFTGTFTEDWDRLTRIYAKGKINLQELTNEQAKLLSMQPVVKAQIELEQKLGEIRTKTAEMSSKHLEGMSNESEQIAKNNQVLREQNEEIGLTAEGLNLLRMARLDANIALEEENLLLAQNIEGNDAEILQRERKINLLKQERSLKGEAAQKEILAAENDETKRRTQTISESIADGIIDGTRQGKSAWDILNDEVKAQWSKTILQPVIKPFVEAGNEFITAAMKRMMGGIGMGPDSGIGGGAGGLGGFLNGLMGGSDSTTLSTGDFARMDRMLSFDGGGYTGPGLRTGGLDGKGGFLAMMHPDETVTDHTKGGRASGDTFVQNVSIGAGASRAEVVAGLVQTRALAGNDRYQANQRGRRV